MAKIRIEAHAKINLSLDVTGKRPDGYHDVRMVMQMIDLHDSVAIDAEQAGEPEIILDPGRPDLPADRGNLAYKAAALFMEASGHSLRTRIDIEKRIPVAAGLAGGSTDAAAVLLGLNELFGQPLSLDKLIGISKDLGADVPFCVMGNASAGGLDMYGNFSCCALAEGIGEKLTPVRAPGSAGALPIFERIWIVLTKPPIEVATSKVYKALDIVNIGVRPDVDEMVCGLLENNLGKVIKNMVNVLENVTLKEYPVVMYTKNKMEGTKAISVLMSGSGPSVFGLYQDKSSAQEACEALRGDWKETYLVKTI